MTRRSGIINGSIGGAATRRAAAAEAALRTDAEGQAAGPNEGLQTT